jgi:hypothetical protein
MSDSPPMLALVSDLMFSSRISAEARAAGTAITILRQPAALAGQEGRGLIVDLNMAGAITAAGEWRAASGLPVIGFVSHVDQDAISQARAAGIEQILPRSKFVVVLPELLKSC